MRNLVICCDGTGNEISENISNVLKLYRCLRKTDKTTPGQLVYYDPAVGTLSRPTAWHRFKTEIRQVLGLLAGYGFDDGVLSAYEFLVKNYQRGDQIYLFGFSRGAYTVRVLAGLIHKVGLITPEQVNLAASGLLTYKQYSDSRDDDLRDLIDAGADESGPLPANRIDLAAQFARITSSRWPTIRFIGVWDTVASQIVPRTDRWFFPSRSELAFTRQNPSVKTFRQAISIDERRRVFRLKKWNEPQQYWSNRFVPDDQREAQDTLQVWFAGTHADVGGGYPEAESAVSKYPLLWMIDEAAKAGLNFNVRTVNQLAWGVQRKNSPYRYVAPDWMGRLHTSLTATWRLLEFLPKHARWKEWPLRKTVFGFYIPAAEPRVIPEGAHIHESVMKRMSAMPDYRPLNLPTTYEIVPMPGAQNLSRLESLFLSIFDEAQIERFAHQFLGPRIAQIVQSEKSSTARAMKLASELEARSLVDQKLFVALREAQPARADVIDETQAAVLGAISMAGESSPAPERTAEPEDSLNVEEASERAPETASNADERAWRDSLNELLRSSASILPEEPPASWIEAAAVLPDFDPLELQRREATSDSDNALTKLAAISDVRPDGRWTLQLRTRREAIARLWDEDRIGKALIRTEGYDQTASGSLYRSILADIVVKRQIEIDPRAGYDWMLAAREIAEWFATSGHRPFDLDRVATLVERYDTIEPLRKLIGTHFRGRDRELELLHKHQHRDLGSKRVLKISGIGGSGKSTLLGKLLLDLEHSDEIPPPWVYLDFDHPEVQPGNPSRLIELIARRLGLLYAGHPSARLFYELESVSAGDPMQSFNLGLPKDAPPGELIEALGRVVSRLPIDPMLLIVFDTFEQAQVQGQRAINGLTKTIEEILAALPYAQIVLSGRSRIDVLPDSTEIQLGDLDIESADAVLEALGIADESARSKLLRTVGTSPLSLNLAATAVKSGQLDLGDAEVFAAGASGVEIQGRLYTRFLGHITDGEVRRLAHPGLVVRRVTPAVIREVLAEICDINPDSAETLFRRLPNHVALFEHDSAAPDETDALRHRQDIREAMIELMTRDPIWRDRFPAIHTKAIEHYRGRPYAITRAEEVYHRLMRNDELDELDALWSEDIAASLGRSWLEPFPERARAWLALRLGRDDVRAPELLRHADWEFYALREVRSYLEAADFDGALSVLAQRSERLPNSPLVPLEIELLRRLRRPKEALELCLAGLAKAQSAEGLQSVLVLHLRAAELGIDLRDKELLGYHAWQVRRIANALNSPLDELRALQVLARGALVDPVLFGDLNKESLLDLERAFVQVQSETLQQAPRIAEDMVRTLGLRSKNVLMKIATTFGNRPDQTLIRADAFLLAELLTEVQRKSGGMKLLSSLATAVGLSKSDFDAEEIASNTIRFGRLGDTLAAVLDAYGDDDRIRNTTTNLFL